MHGLFFNILLSAYSHFNTPMNFKIDKFIDIVTRRKTPFVQLDLMLHYPLIECIGYTSVECSVIAIGKDVNEIPGHM